MLLIITVLLLRYYLIKTGNTNPKLIGLFVGCNLFIQSRIFGFKEHFLLRFIL